MTITGNPLLLRSDDTHILQVAGIFRYQEGLCGGKKYMAFKIL